MNKRFKVLAHITPANFERLEGIARLAGEKKWLLNILDRMGGLEPSTDYDGVLVTLRKNSKDLEFVRRLRRRGVPVVDLTIQHPEIDLPRVISDHFEIGRSAERHFSEHGLVHVAWFSSGWSHVHALRFKGLGEDRDVRPVRIVTNDRSKLSKRIMELPKPCGLLCYDESDAVFALNCALDAGISIPDELAILAIGDDRIILDHQALSISRITLNPARSGYAAAALLDRLMRGGKTPDEPTLIRPDGIITATSTETYSSEDPIARRVLLYIRDNLEHPFGAAQIADAFRISRSKLDKLCVAAFGHSIGREILTRRLAEAKRLLKTTDKTISEISQATGFCADTYFIKIFHDDTGISPQQWRRTLSGQAKT